MKIDRQKLANVIRSLQGVDDEVKSQLLGLLNKKESFGLKWDEKSEDAEEQMSDQLPVLQEVSSRRILSDDPTAPNHVLIEGDNLHALTSLCYTHEGEIDVIYIDPPYNTGNKDFIYNDSYVDAEDGYRHSKWLSFMKRRLSIAKRLLSAKGVVFISIDDHEQANLKILCDEVFGEKNFINQFIWYINDGHTDNQDEITVVHEYILCYAKNASATIANHVVDPSIGLGSKILNSYAENSITKNGVKNPPSIITLKEGFPCEVQVLHKKRHGNIEELMDEAQSFGYIARDAKQKYKVEYPARLDDMIVKNGKLTKDCRVFSGWMNSDKLKTFIDNNFKPLDDNNTKLRFYLSKNGVIYYKREGRDPRYIQTVIERIGTTETNKYLLESMGISFDFPKPISLIQYLLSIYSSSASTILDFFAGSGTTLHATMQLNVEDGGHRQCILVTNNENGICENVTYVRNKCVIKGYTTPKGEHVEGLKANNLRYYKTEFVDRERTSRNMRTMMKMATDMLCIKEDLYDEVEGFGQLKKNNAIYRHFCKEGKQMLMIYREDYIDDFIAEIEKMEVLQPIHVYVFSPSNDPFTESFDVVADKVKLVALPAAILEAYKEVLPPKKENFLPEFESQVQTKDEEEKEVTLDNLFD